MRLAVTMRFYSDGEKYFEKHAKKRRKLEAGESSLFSGFFRIPGSASFLASSALPNVNLKMKKRTPSVASFAFPDWHYFL